MIATESTLYDARLIRGGGVLWLLGALAAGLLGEQSELAGSFAYYLVGGLFTIAFLAPLIGFRALHVRHAQSTGRLGRTAALLAVSGTTLMFVATLANTVAGRWVAALTPPFLLGFLLGTAGSALLGILLLRARELSLWYGVMLVLLFPLVGILGPLLGNVAVGLLQGLAWTTLASQLLREPNGGGSSGAHSRPELPNDCAAGDDGLAILASLE
jgi:hypothetical protein